MVTDFCVPPVTSWALAEGIGGYSSGKIKLIRLPTQTCSTGPVRFPPTSQSSMREGNERGVVLLYPKPKRTLICSGWQPVTLT